MIPSELSARVATLADLVSPGGQVIVRHPATARVLAVALTELGRPAKAVTTPAELAASRAAPCLVTTARLPMPGSPIIYVAQGDWPVPQPEGATILGPVGDHRRAHRASGALARAVANPHRLDPPPRWPAGTLPGAPRIAGGLALADLDEPVYGDRLRTDFAQDGEFPEYLRPHCERVLARWRPAHRPEVVVAAPWPAGQYRIHHGALAISRLLGLPFAGRLVGPSAPLEADPATRVRALARHVRLNTDRLDVPALSGKRVLLVGQLWQEGWTMSMYAQLLAGAGAREVTGLTLAKRSPWTSPLARPARRH
ncbi:MAG: hypothetical protein Q4P33_05610 [Flaviflexus sp.]|nr:hypothetical protein [Flaviflexus sp.]